MSPTTFATIKNHFFARLLTGSNPVNNVHATIPFSTTMMMRANHQLADIVRTPSAGYFHFQTYGRLGFFVKYMGIVSN